MIKVLASFGLQREPACHNFCLYGSEGTLETTRDGSYFTNAYLKGSTGVAELTVIKTGLSRSDAPGDLLRSHGGADYLMIRDFVSSVLGGTPPRVGIDLAIDMSLPGI